MPLVAVDSTRAKELDELAQRLANPDLSQAELETTQAKMILLQEELDWAVYAAFGLEPAPDADAELPAGLQLGERAFEIAMARRMEAGELQTTWFVRHGSTPRTTLPDHWSSSYRAVVERRLEVMDQSREMRLLEQPEHKRRWVFESWEDRVSARSRSQALDGIEEALRAGLSRPTAITVNQLADRLAVNQELTGALSALNAEDQDRALADLVRSEAVPAMPVEYLKPPGLRKRAEWEKVWAAQVVEDPFLEEQDQVLETQFGSTPEEQRRARAHVACWKTSDLVTKKKGLSDAEHAQIGMAGGQSGHPGDPHYDDALADWLAGRPRPLWMHWSDVAYHQVGTWELRPPGD